MTRKDYIKLIHIARNMTFRCPACGKLISKEMNISPVCNDCGLTLEPLSDADYRKLLSNITGKESSKFLADEELEKVYQLFISCGFRPRTESRIDQIEHDYQEGRRKTISIILSEARRTLGPSWQYRLEKFIASKNNGQTMLYKLPDNQLRQILGWVRRNAKTLQKRNETKF